MSSLRFTTRVAAYALITLVIVPFSPPLSVCEVSDLVAKPTASLHASPSIARRSVPVVSDASAQWFPIGANIRIRVAAALRSPSPVEAAGNTPLSESRVSTTNPGPARPLTKTILRI